MRSSVIQDDPLPLKLLPHTEIPPEMAQSALSDTSWGGSGLIPPGESPREDTGHAGGTMFWVPLAEREAVSLERKV